MALQSYAFEKLGRAQEDNPMQELETAGTSMTKASASNLILCSCP